MECPVCRSFPVSVEIFTCLNGHILCGLCRSRVKYCPLCREPDITRSQFCERLIKNAFAAQERVLCRYHEWGCDAILRITRMYEHELWCEYKQPKELTDRKKCLCILCFGQIHRPVLQREPTVLCEYVEDWADMLTAEKCCCTYEDPCSPLRDPCDCYQCHSIDCTCASVCHHFWNSYTTCSHYSNRCEGHS